MLKLSQEIKMQQKLDFRMIQSLKLLPLNTIQLTQRINEELEQNPMLQAEEKPEASEEQKKNTSDESGQVKTTDNNTSDSGDFTEAEWLKYMEDGFSNDYRVRQEYDPNIEERESIHTYMYTMSDHLTEQLGISVNSEYDREIGEFIIGSLNDDGFLENSDEDIAQDLDVPVKDVNRLIDVIQHFDPPGIAARDLRECLLLQLEDRNMKGTIAWYIIADQFEQFTKRKNRDILKALQVNEDQFRDAMDDLSTLSPRPGAIFNDTGNMAIIPDIVVEKIEGTYIVMLNDRYVPQLTISSQYRRLLDKKAGTAPETRKYLVDKLNSARWFINSIEQRRSTILRVSNAIVERQEAFLDHGIAHLRPMTLQDIADQIGVAISTVQRVTTGKYMQTPQGVYEMKYFFTQRIATSNGTEDMSAKSVKDRLSRLIESENPQKPLSDQKITDILNGEGISISRRAIAKYRDELQIPPARLRKQL